MPCFKHLGDYLSTCRKRTNISQVELGKKLGYKSSQFVSNWERGLCAPPMESINKIVKLINANKIVIGECMLMDAKQEIEARLKVRL